MLLLPAAALADQTYFVSGEGPVYVEDPSLPAVYNRTLAGSAQEFAFPVVATGTVRIRLAIPERDGERSVSARIVNGFGDPVVKLLPDARGWRATLIDPRTGRYLVGAEFASELVPDTYSVRVESPDAEGAYAMVFGTLAGEEDSAPAAADHRTRNQVIIGAILAVFLGAIVVRIANAKRVRRK